MLVAACALVLDGGLKLCFPSSRRSGHYFAPGNWYRRCAAKGEAPQFGCLPDGQASRPNYWAAHVRRAFQAMLHLDSTRCAKGAAIRAPPCSRCVAHHLGKPFAPSVCMLRSGFRRETCAFFQRFLFRNMWMRNRHAAGVLHTWCRDNAGSRSRPVCSSRVCVRG